MTPNSKPNLIYGIYENLKIEGEVFLIWTWLTFCLCGIPDVRDFTPRDIQPCAQPEVTTAGEFPGQPLPRLHQQFEARVEAKIIQKGYTVDVEEYYDYPNNRGMVRRMKGGVLSTWLYDFTDSESFLIIDKTCMHSDMRREGFQFFNFTAGDHNGHIGGVTDLFNFGTKYNETFLGGNETVRGIPVNHWTSCIEWDRSGTVFKLDYYFSKPDYKTALGPMEIPVRAILKGQVKDESDYMHALYHVYDFVFYRPGPIRETTVFEVPRGIVCKHKTGSKPRPILPDRFTMEVEMVQPQDEVVSLRKYFYDYNLKLSRYDLEPTLRSMTSWGEAYGYRPITLIHDYNRGIQYVIDSVSRNCSRSAITMDTVDADPRMADPSHVMMRHGQELFDLDQLNFSYQGKKEFRQTSCEVWAALRVDWPQSGTNTTIEVYFNQDNWTMAPNGNMSPRIVGLWLTLVDSTDNFVEEWVNHIYSYRAADPELALFDVYDCHPEDEKFDVECELKASYHEVVRSGSTHLVQALRIQLAEVAGVQPLRISNIKIADTIRGSTLVTMTILSDVSLKDDESRQTIVTTQQAYNVLTRQAAKDKGIVIIVTYESGIKEYDVIQNSLQATPIPEQSKIVEVQQGHMYSAGSMAVLGLCMLLLGLVLGAGGIYFHKLKKRPIDIPYRVQD